MSIGTVMPSPKFTAYDNDGNPIAGGKVYFYAAGTTTPQATYTTSALTTPNANPVILDAGGRASIFWSASTYKVKLTTAADVDVWTVDGVASITALATAVSALTVTLKSGSVVAGELVPDSTRNDVFYVGANITSNVRSGGQDASTRPSWAWSFDTRVSNDAAELLHIPVGGAGTSTTLVTVQGNAGAVTFAGTVTAANYGLVALTDTGAAGPPGPRAQYPLPGLSGLIHPTAGVVYFATSAALEIATLQPPNVGVWQVYLINTTANTVTLDHRAAGTPGKINCSTAANVVLGQYQGGWLFYGGSGEFYFLQAKT